MPVNILLCEGRTDALVLNRIVGDVIGQVVPCEGKTGMPSRVMAHRQAHAGYLVAGIRDSDFDFAGQEPHAPQQRPQPWTSTGGANCYGWRWERVEIENYLIDPAVVQRMPLERRPDAAAYQAALHQARDMLTCYTAARIALVLARPAPGRMPDSWGHESKLGHCFPCPADCTEDACRRAIDSIATDYQARQLSRKPDELFEAVLPQCQAGGIRFQHYLTFFSGKDLLVAMREALIAWGFTPTEFRATIIKCMERSTESVWEWLPEWAQLHTNLEHMDSDKYPCRET